MNARTLPFALVASVALTSGCAETARDRVSVPLFVAGTDVSESLVATGDVPVSLDRADLAFGPLYLCAGAAAGDLCDTAVLEWLDSVVIDTTSPDPVAAGALSGVTGPVRSWMYDLGISSQLTRAQPFVLPAARRLNGASFVVEGRANADGVEVPFRASVPIQQTDDTELGVPVVRKSTSDSFFRDVVDGEAGLVVRFDPAAWLRTIDFRPYVKREQCSPGGPALACTGSIEITCDADGAEASSRDCNELGQHCFSGQGCAEAVTFAPETEPFRSLRNALVSGARPAFEWGFVP